jgi:hypothetical protein
MTILFLAILIGLIPAFIAHAKGENFFVWWFYGAAIFIIALPHAIFLKNKNEPVPIMEGHGKQYIERREERGMGGKVALVAFALFNIFMAAWFISYLYQITEGAKQYAENTDLYNAYVLGGLLGNTVLFVLWALGDAIIGGLLLLTRGNKIIEVVEAGLKPSELPDPPNADHRIKFLDDLGFYDRTK